VIPASLQAWGVALSLPIPTSICRSRVTIYSGLYLWMAITGFLLGGFSRSTWYKNPGHVSSATMGVSLMDATIQAEAATPAATLRCELITEFSRLEQLSVDWQRLWCANPDAEIFQSFAWVRAWWRCYGDIGELCSPAVFEGEQVIGIVPLVKDGDQIVFLGGKYADYCDILCQSGRAAEVFEAALENLLQLPGWKECVLRNLKVDGQIFRELVASPKRSRHLLQVVPCEDCHTIVLGENHDVLVSLLGKGHTKRRLNKLRKAGVLTFRHIETRTEAQAQLSEFFRHQMRRFALVGKASPSPKFCTFLRNLVDELDPAKELRFGVLELNDRPLAWHFSFHVNGKLLFYQQTFDVDVWDYSPGEVLIHELLRYAQENVTREFDFTHGDEPFKDRFTTNTRESYSLYIERTGFRGELRRVLRASVIPWLRFRRRLQRLAKRQDETFHRFRAIRLWASGVLARIRYHRQRGTLLTWGGNSVMRRLRSLRFNRREIALFPPSSVNEGATGVAAAANSSFGVRKGGLGDLVDIALRHPEIVVLSELARYRQRLKRGDQVYLVQQGEEVVLAGWTTTCRPNDTPRFRAVQKAASDAPLMLLDECWTVSKALETVHYRQLLCAVSNDARKRHLVLGVCCPDEFPTLRSELTCSEV